VDKTDQILYIVSSLRKEAYSFIESQLENNGIKGLTYTHGAILYALYDSEGVMRLSDIARIINRKKPTVTVLVEKLEKMKLVKKEKSPHDSRVTMVSITEKGKKLNTLFDSIGTRLKAKAFRGIPAGSQELLADLLLQMEQNFNEDRDKE
jgi:DNA-binding MarR family transcriptional regulator